MSRSFSLPLLFSLCIGHHWTRVSHLFLIILFILPAYLPMFSTLALLAPTSHFTVVAVCHPHTQLRHNIFLSPLCLLPYSPVFSLSSSSLILLFVAVSCHPILYFPFHPILFFPFSLPPSLSSAISLFPCPPSLLFFLISLLR